MTSAFGARERSRARDGAERDAQQHAREPDDTETQTPSGVHPAAVTAVGT